MRRGTLAVGAAIVVAAVIGLYILLRADSQPAPVPAHRDPPDQRIADVGPGKARNRPVPVLRQDGSAAPGRTAGPLSSHDHRAAEPAAVDPPPDPPAGRRINVQVTSDLSQVLRSALQECAANLAPGTAGDLSRVEGQVVIAIKDHQASVTSASFQLHDFAEAAQADIQQCLVQRAVGVTAPADEPDIDSYPITVSLRWP
ncbi:MAG TPA: hypothetical protein VHT91_47380 [Kofleriaceae bacterium]|jgi:hypothetical protein|nr:hypothetical protein [Kofleriaceae bacterium]